MKTPSMCGSTACGSLLALVLWTLPSSAAPPTDGDRARSLFKEGRALVQEGQIELGCTRFQESLQLDVGMGTKFNLADCWERLGRTASAQKLFLEVATTAHESGQPEREQAARERATGLDPKLARLVIDVKIAAPALEIRRDGVVVPPASWGAPVPVDPGTHRLEVSAPGRRTWAATIDVPTSAATSMVDVPDLEPTQVAAAAAPIATPAPEPPPVKEAAPSESAAPRSDNTVPIILYAGVGAGAILAGTSLFLYKRSNDQALEFCVRGAACSASDIARHDGFVDDARTARGLAYLGFGISGAALITGGLIALTRSHGREGSEADGVKASPVVGPSSIGAAVTGRF